jgi:hypothetical protein
MVFPLNLFIKRSKMKFNCQRAGNIKFTLEVENKYKLNKYGMCSSKIRRELKL